MSEHDSEREVELRRARGAIGASLAVSVIGSAGFLVAYWGDHGTQAEGATLAVALGGLAIAAGVWGLKALPERVAVEHRASMASSSHERESAAETARLGDVGVGVGRRRGLLALLSAAGAALVAAFASPLRSLGPSPFPERERTSWRSGLRLVDADGVPIRVDDLQVDAVETVFPEGDEHRSQSQVILIRMEPGALRLPSTRADWAPQGYVAYSKVCTHAGCPVALYDPDFKELLCPCHQSVFKADEGARPSFGPAARALPQLPLGVDDEGFLIALGDFPEPIGPSYWSLS